MFRNSLSWYIFVVSIFELIIKTHPTLHDSSHGFVSKNPRYFDDDLYLNVLQEELGLPKKSSHVPQKFQLKFDSNFLDCKARPKGQLVFDPLIILTSDKNSSNDATSVSKDTVNVFNSLFQNRIIGANTFSHYRIRPLVGIKLPLNSTFAPLIYLHNSHLEPLQIVEIHSSSNKFNLELPNGEEEGSNFLWEIPPHETKAIIRVHFFAHELKNYSASIRIRLHKPDRTLMVPVEVEVTPEMQLIHPRGYIDLGLGGDYDPPKEFKLCLLNPNKKPVRVHSLTTTSKAIKIKYYNIRIPPAIELQDSMSQCVDVATLTVDWKTAYETKDFSGKIVVKFRNGRNKSEIFYHMDVLKGGLTYDPLITTYFINDKANGLSLRAFKVKNQFNDYIYILDVLLPADIQSYFKVKVLTPKILKPGEDGNIFFIELKNNMRLSDLQLQSQIVILTNISDIKVPLISYNGKLQVHLPFKSKDYSLDIGLVGFNARKEVYFMIVNVNPVTLNLKHIHSSIPMTSAEVIGCASGEYKLALFSPSFKYLKKCHNLKAGNHAIIKVTVGTTQIEGQVWGDIYVETQFENLKVPVHFKIASGKLEIGPDKLIFDQCFPGKVCSHPLRIYSTFNDPMIILDILAIPPDKRISSRHTGHIIARTSKIVGHLFFNPDLECRSECYTGLQSDTTAQWLTIFNFSKYVADFDLHLMNTFYNRYLNVTSHGMKKWQNLTLRLDTTEVKGHIFNSRVKMSWPRLIVDPNLYEKATVNFPLTQVGNVTYHNITIKNPASYNVVVQLVFDRDYPGFETLYAAMPPSLVIKMNDKHSFRGFFFHNRTRERQQHQFFNMLGVRAHKESIPVLLTPGQTYTFPVGFYAEDAEFHSAVLLLRNNLTILELVRLNARGVQPTFKFGNRKPGSAQPLTFEMTDRHFHDCERQRLYPEDSNFSIKRTFTAKNIGEVTLYVNSFYINNYRCEGYGFRVLNCEPFALHPNQTKKIDIAFTPDFTLSKVSRTLIILTSLNVPVNYTLFTTIPPVYLNMCSDVISRPTWEIFLSYLTVVSMAVLIIVILCLAAIDAERIRQQAISSFILPSSMTVQPVLDLRLVGQQTREEIQTSKIAAAPVKEEKKTECTEKVAEKEVEVEVKPKPELERYTVLVPTTGKVRKRLANRNGEERAQNEQPETHAGAGENKEEKPDRKKEKYSQENKYKSKEAKEATLDDKDKEKEKDKDKDKEKNVKENKKYCNKKYAKNNIIVPVYLEEETSSTSTDSSGGVNEDPEKENNQRPSAKLCSKTKSPNAKRDNAKNGLVTEANPNHTAELKYVNCNQSGTKFRHQKTIDKKAKINEKQKKECKEYEPINQKTTEQYNQPIGKHGHPRELKKRERIVKERKEKVHHRKSLDKIKQADRSGVSNSSNNPPNAFATTLTTTNNGANAAQDGHERYNKNSPTFNVPLPPPPPTTTTTTVNTVWGESCAKFSDVVARSEPNSVAPANKTVGSAVAPPLAKLAVAKPAAFVEPYKQASLTELGPIGSRRSDNRRSSAEVGQEPNGRRKMELNGNALNLLVGDGANSYFSDSIRLDNVIRENGFVNDLNANSWNPHESFGNVLDTSEFAAAAADRNTIMEDPWNQNLLNTSTYWDSYNPLLGDNPLLNGANSLLEDNCLLNKNSLLGDGPLLGENSFSNNDKEVVSTPSNVYLWGSSSVWQPWAPECTSNASRTPTTTPPVFDEFLSRTDDCLQPQIPHARENYSPFNTSPLWTQQQQNPWNYSQGQ